MKCLDYRQLASLYIDRRLDHQVNQEFLHHMNSCEDCFRYVEEISGTSRLLGLMGKETPPDNLAAEIMTAVRYAHEPRPNQFLVWLRNFSLYGRPNYIAYATSFVLTCLLFVSVLYDIQPSFRFARSLEDNMIDAMMPSTPRLNETLPSVRSASAIVELTFETSPNPSTNDLFVIAEITTEGRATLIQLVGAPNNPQLERNVDAALKRVTFSPATKAGRPVNARLLLFIQTIDVQG